MKNVTIDKKLTDNKFLNLYSLNVHDEKKSKDFSYYVASRRSEKELACVTKNHNKCDAVMVVPIIDYKEIVLIKQFRPAINDYIYEFPAGLMDENESIKETAKRELFEETGLKTLGVSLYLDPSYTSVGMSDETCAVCLAYATGELTNKYTEGNEDITPVKIPVKDACKFIKSNNVSIKTALIMKTLFGLMTLRKEI